MTMENKDFTLYSNFDWSQIKTDSSLENIFCEDEDFLNDTLEKFEYIYNTTIDLLLIEYELEKFIYSNFFNMKDSLCKMYIFFIDKIYNFFIKKYSLKNIEKYFLYQIKEVFKNKQDNLIFYEIVKIYSPEEILKQTKENIQSQVKFSFRETAIDDLKQDFFNLFFNYNKPTIVRVNNFKLIADLNLIKKDYYSKKLELVAKENFKKFIDFLFLFEFGSIPNYNPLSEIASKENLNNKFEAFSKIISFKMFLNCKLEINFSSQEHLDNFINILKSNTKKELIIEGCEQQ